jgi:hypothetical protein
MPAIPTITAAMSIPVIGRKEALLFANKKKQKNLGLA